MLQVSPLKPHKAAYEKQIQEKQSEVDVLKDMVKGTNLQVKAKEKEITKLKTRCKRYEDLEAAGLLII